MQLREAEFIGNWLSRFPNSSLSPLLDIGSSTREFRTQTQPYIEEKIFAPLKHRGVQVYHADVKPAEGIDLVGDLLDPVFQSRLIELKVRTVLAASVFHHVLDIEVLSNAVVQVVEPGGYIIVSGPFRYPVHRDPIDNGWRPTPVEAARLFPETDVIDATVIDGGNWRQWRASERGGRSLSRFLARLCVPICGFKSWKEVVAQSPYLLLHIKTFVLVLKRR